MVAISIGKAMAGLMVAYVVGVLIKKATEPATVWHQGPKWEAYFEVYDRLAAEQYGDCDNRLVAHPRFGSTQVHMCGNPSNPPVFFLHGMGTCSLIWGDWTMPKLSQTHYVVAVDHLCDIGRSLPKAGDPASCPNGREEIAEWIVHLKTELEFGTDRPISMVGISYGSYLSSQVALARPEHVDRLVLMAPTLVFAPLPPSFMFRAVSVGIINFILPFEAVQKETMRYFFTYMTADPEFNFEKFPNWDLFEATDAVGPAKPLGELTMVEAADRAKMSKSCPTLMVVGEGETAYDAAKAVAAAKEAGVQVKLYKNAGHFLLAEHPRDDIVNVVAEFLSNGEGATADASSTATE